MRSKPPLQALLLLAVAAGVALIAPDPVHASCSAPPPEVFWSYPADGARDVSTDALIWLVTSLGGLEKVTLNDEPLEMSLASFSAGALDPGPLEPDTDYVLRLEFPSHVDPYGDGGTATPIEIAFHTGSTKSVQPAAPAVGGHHISTGPGSTGCQKIISSQDCFDTFQNTYLEFDVAPSAGAIAWLVQSDYLGTSTVWPNECSKPTVFMHAVKELTCFNIYSIGTGGKLSDATQHCVEPEAAPDPKSDPQPAPQLAPPGGLFADAGPAGAARVLPPSDAATPVGEPGPGFNRPAKKSEGCSVDAAGAAADGSLRSAWLGLAAAAFVLRTRRRSTQR